MGKFEEIKFTTISAPDFEGELEVLSVKIPATLKELLKNHGEQRGRKLSDVVEHALTQYGKHVLALDVARKKKS